MSKYLLFEVTKKSISYIIHCSKWRKITSYVDIQGSTMKNLEKNWNDVDEVKKRKFLYVVKIMPSLQLKYLLNGIKRYINLMNY